MDWKTNKLRETVSKCLSSIMVIPKPRCRKQGFCIPSKKFSQESQKGSSGLFQYIKKIIIMSVSEFPLILSFFITQLSATSTSRAAFMQCLRWGIWCPFQEPDVWKGGEIQLVLQGGAKPNPHGVMVYGTQTSTKTQGSAALSARDTAQVTHQHRECII